MRIKRGHFHYDFHVMTKTEMNLYFVRFPVAYLRVGQRSQYCSDMRCVARRQKRTEKSPGELECVLAVDEIISESEKNNALATGTVNETVEVHHLLVHIEMDYLWDVNFKSVFNGNPRLIPPTS